MRVLQVDIVAATALGWHNILPRTYPSPQEPQSWKALDLRDWDLNPATGEEEPQVSTHGLLRLLIRAQHLATCLSENDAGLYGRACRWMRGSRVKHSQ
jgi:hypothetical protein